MDGERAIEVYSSAQMKLKRLAEMNKEKRDEVKEEMEKHKEVVKQFMETQKIECLPFFVKDQQAPLFVRLQKSTKYKSVTEADLKQLVDEVITAETLKTYQQQSIAENKSASSRKRGAEAYEPPVAAVLLNVVADGLLSKFSVVSQYVKITKAKARGFKMDPDNGPAALPPPILASVSEVHRCDTTLKDLRKKTIARKRKYEETKQKALPIIASYLKPNEKQEVDVRGLDGKVKTYEMTAVASKKHADKVAVAAGKSVDAAGEAKNVGGNGSAFKVSARELEGELDASDAFYNVPAWKVRFSEWNGLANLAQVKKQVLETLLKTFQHQVDIKKNAKKKKDVKQAVAEESPVTVKMRLKGRSSEASDDDDDGNEDDAAEVSE
jgi:hypothetical protein